MILLNNDKKLFVKRFQHLLDPLTILQSNLVTTLHLSNRLLIDCYQYLAQFVLNDTNTFKEPKQDSSKDSRCFVLGNPFAKVGFDTSMKPIKRIVAKSIEQLDFFS